MLIHGDHAERFIINLFFRNRKETMGNDMKLVLAVKGTTIIITNTAITTVGIDSLIPLITDRAWTFS